MSCCLSRADGIRNPQRRRETASRLAHNQEIGGSTPPAATKASGEIGPKGLGGPTDE